MPTPSSRTMMTTRSSSGTIMAVMGWADEYLTAFGDNESRLKKVSLRQNCSPRYFFWMRHVPLLRSSLFGRFEPTEKCANSSFSRSTFHIYP